MYAKEEPGTSPELSPYLDPEPSPKKSRRSVQKRVVSLPVPEAEGPRLKSGGEAAPPPDSWAWRKYGQKPIKGSPYPRGGRGGRRALRRTRRAARIFCYFPARISGPSDTWRGGRETVWIGSSGGGVWKQRMSGGGGGHTIVPDFCFFML
ncbi:putative WRKY transcription factor 65 [Dendrobium catenatum]|uniref:Putative WRKY transcription factor 65 n=1 Tax=Dendrobium catenatum TaxID=906689 RepID=A0A2I0WUE1_9ASPA|nr:putative WRKY transcription factor 65 [Dendrobium catenatum]